MTTAIICAMEKELNVILEQTENVESRKIGGLTVHKGKLCGKDVVMCVSGIGKAYAAVATALVIQNYAPSVVINSGVAGGVPQTKQGDVVISRKTVEHDFTIPDEQPEYYLADNDLYQKACFAAMNIGARFHGGVIATGDCFVDNQETVARIQNKFGAIAFDMESAAVMKTAKFMGVKCVCVRVISDNGTDDNMKSYYDFLPEAVARNVEITKKVIETL